MEEQQVQRAQGKSIPVCYGGCVLCEGQRFGNEARDGRVQMMQGLGLMTKSWFLILSMMGRLLTVFELRSAMIWLLSAD